jgi:8-oxo-dGTP pyrophosphatase MutT (NUDIX family)
MNLKGQKIVNIKYHKMKCGDYDQEIDNSLVKKAGAIIHCPHTDRLLLVFCKASKKWGFAKGCVEESEVPFDTAQREVKEEVGIDCLKTFNTNVITSYNNEIVYFQHSCDSRSLCFKNMKPLDDEIEKVAWISITKLRLCNKRFFTRDLTIFLRRKYLV